MPLQPKGGEPEQGRDAAGQRQRQEEADPGGVSVEGRHPGGGIGRDPDESRLSERDDAADAGEKREADRDQRIHPDIVHQRDRERGQEEGRGSKAQHRHHCRQLDVKTGHSSISSSECREDRDRQIRIGIRSENTMTSFSALLSKDAKLSRMPTPTAPIAAPG